MQLYSREGEINMWTVVKIRADYEGWWLFEDWPQKIVEQSEFTTYDQMLDYYINVLNHSKKCYDNYVVNFCEDCEEDLQIFYSFIILKNNEVYFNLPKID